MKQHHKFLGRHLVSALGLLLGAPAIAGTPLINPNGDEIYFLQQEYSQTTPVLNSLAQADDSVINADEFQKQHALNQVVGQLKQQEASVKGVTTITVDLNTTFTPYDSDYGEYDFNISDGTYIPYTAFQETYQPKAVQIDLINGTDAQSWSLKPDLAQSVLDKTGGTREVILALKLQLESSPPGVQGQPLVLNAKVLSYDVLTQTGGIRIGHVDVQDSD